MNRDVFANAVVAADDERAARLGLDEVLGLAADDRPFADLVVAPRIVRPLTIARASSRQPSPMRTRLRRRKTGRP